MSPESDRRTTQCHEIIRKAGETDEHDLAHFTAANAKELIIAAFEKPIVCKEMHRVTFTVGGGKLVRQKYPESLSKGLLVTDN
mmetsp:Transcript_41726/g.81858  ORF Transcript_41726/g.81858 Transcript_41726/m.81858 type:complete len:83 (+) Transcript_41726:593-841(+)